MSLNYNVVYIDLNTGKEEYLDKALNSPYKQFKYVQMEPATIWTMFHQQDSNSMVTIFYDQDGNEMEPSKFYIHDNTTTVAEFNIPISGQALLLFFDNNTLEEISNLKQMMRRYSDGMAVAQNEIYDQFLGYQYTQSSTALEWNITHSIGEVALINIFSNNEEIIPDEIIEVDNCTTKLTFNTPVSGFANIIFLVKDGSNYNCS